eukprot:13510920-Alexandrium_andersonii.AAC.1
MAAPTTTDWAALVRLIRYLVVRPGAFAIFRGRMKGPPFARSSIPTLLGVCGPGGPRAGVRACEASTPLSI